MAYELGTTYQLFSHCGTGLCLGVSGGTVANNKNVCIQTKNSNNQQKWIVKAFGSNLKIVSCLNQNYALNYYWSAGQGNAGNCDIYPQSGNDTDSSVVLEPVATDVYRIKLKNYNLYLTAKGTGANADVRWEAPVNKWSDYTLLGPQEWRFVDTSAKGIRAPLIYAGFFSENQAYHYDDNQLKGLDNATEFVICSGVYNGYFTSNGQPNSEKIQQYVEAATQMVKKLNGFYSAKKFWIGTPHVGNNVIYEGNAGKSAFTNVGTHIKSFFDSITKCFSQEGLSFSNCVKGIYMDREGIINPFNSTIAISGNCEVNMFQTVANYVATKGKKMLWIPYWSDVNDIIKVACVAQRTNIFDYMLIQPGYYENANNKNCEAVRKAIAMQRVCYQNQIPILHEEEITCRKTIIGCEMEIAPNYVSDVSAQERYQTYTTVFNQSYGAYSKYNADFAFYFGCPKIGTTVYPGYDTVKKMVNTFFQ